MSDKMRELLPCPFCGGPVEIEKTIDGRKWYGVVCRNTFNRGGTCAVSIRPSASEECAIERWNMRAQSAAVPDGWQLVPIQPSPDMVDAVLRHANGNDLQFYGANELRKEIAQDWEMMLAAAPLVKNG